MFLSLFQCPGPGYVVRVLHSSAPLHVPALLLSLSHFMIHNSTCSIEFKANLVHSAFERMLLHRSFYLVKSRQQHRQCHEFKAA